MVWFVNESKLLGMCSVWFGLSVRVCCCGCVLCSLVCQWKEVVGDVFFAVNLSTIISSWGCALCCLVCQ